MVEGFFSTDLGSCTRGRKNLPATGEKASNSQSAEALSRFGYSTSCDRNTACRLHDSAPPKNCSGRQHTPRILVPVKALCVGFSRYSSMHDADFVGPLI